METKIIEAMNGPRNWGKFMVCRPDSEWGHRSEISEYQPLLAVTGWTDEHLWVLDLQTGEGACFQPDGYAKADLDKHKIWVCPLFEPFLTWLYQQDLTNGLQALPSVVSFSTEEAPFGYAGYRRGGPITVEMQEETDFVENLPAEHPSVADDPPLDWRGAENKS